MNYSIAFGNEFQTVSTTLFKLKKRIEMHQNRIFR